MLFAVTSASPKTQNTMDRLPCKTRIATDRARHRRTPVPRQLRGIHPIAAAIALCLAACSELSGSPPPSPTLVSIQEQELSNSRRQLVYGYAQLHQAANALADIDSTISKQFHSKYLVDHVSQVAARMATLQQSLEQLAGETDWLGLNDPGLPEVELSRRQLSEAATMLEYLPAEQRLGREFERSVWMNLSAALIDLRHLLRELIAREHSADRHMFLEQQLAQTNLLLSTQSAMLDPALSCDRQRAAAATPRRRS